MKSLGTTAISNRLNTPYFPLTSTAVLYAAFVIIRLAVHGWDTSYFVTAGDAFTDPAQVPANFHVMHDAQGHDAQFYYRLALDPFTNKVTDHGITLDLPAYRQQRILLPVVLHILSGGSAEWIPFWMLAINYVGLCVFAWFASKYVRTFGLHAAWALALACYPGFVLTLARDFTEIFAASLVMPALWCIRVERHRTAAILLTFGVWARETTLLISVAFVAAALLLRAREGIRRPILVYSAPVLAGIAWQIFLRYNWGHFASADTGTLSPPFLAYVHSLLEKTAFSSGQQTAAFFQMLLVTAFAIAVACAVRGSKAPLFEKATWVLYALLACIVSENVWSEDWSFLRNLWELYVFGAIVLMTSASRVRVSLFACWTGLWLFEFFLRMDLHKLIQGTV